MAQQVKRDIVLTVLAKISGGFWPSDKEVNQAVSDLGERDRQMEALTRRVDELSAALNPFAKMGAKVDYAIDIPIIDHGSLQVTYSDLVKAADVLYGVGLVPPKEKKD